MLEIPSRHETEKGLYPWGKKKRCYWGISGERKRPRGEEGGGSTGGGEIFPLFLMSCSN